MNNIFIYSLNCPITNNPKYIGKTNNLRKRLRGHLKEHEKTKKNNWIKSLRSKGLKPIMRIIDKVENSEWIFWEQHYISLYRSWGFDLKNMTDGGEGTKMTDEIRKKQSEARKGIRPVHLIGYKHSDETKRVLSEKAKGRAVSESEREQRAIRMTGAKHESLRKKICQMDSNGNVVKIWDAIKVAERELNISHGHIGQILRGKRNTAKGFYWKYHEKIN